MKSTKRILCLFLSLCMMISCMAGLGVTASADADPRIIVSLGDSYSSGEGIAPYYGSEKALADRVLDHDWLAHRSKTSWGSQLKLDGVPMTRDTNWFFAAASGAEAKDISGSQSIEYDRNEYYGTAHLEPQISIFDGLTLTGNDYVTMTLGGNDVGFVDIMTVAVVTPTELDQKISDALTRFTDTVRPALKAVYKTIAEKAGDAAILVAGYPTLLNPEGFNITYMTASLPVPAETSVKVNAAVNTLNQELSALVSECADEGMNIHFVDVQSVFNGHEAYTEEEYINGICFDRSEDDIKFGIISSASIHPNAKGAAAYAKAVQAKIDDLDNPAVCTVTYDGNGATSGNVPADTRKYRRGEAATVLGNTGRLAKEGCKFVGWAESDDATDAEYTAGSKLTVSKENTTLYAVWKEAAAPSRDPVYTGVIPSYTPPSDSTATPAETAPAAAKFTVNGEEDRENHSSALSWEAVSDASGYTLYVKVGGKYVFLLDLGTSNKADIVLGTNGKYYVSVGGDYTICKYNEKTGKFDKAGTFKASDIGGVVKANNVTCDFMVKYKDKNGRECSDENSCRVSVTIYYKPAPTLTTGRNKTTGKSYIRLGWAKVEGAAAYKVCKYVDGKLRTVTELGADSLSLKINGTKSGQKYTYAVKALVDGKWTKVYASDLAGIISK